MTGRDGLASLERPRIISLPYVGGVPRMCPVLSARRLGTYCGRLHLDAYNLGRWIGSIASRRIDSRAIVDRASESYGVVHFKSRNPTFRCKSCSKEVKVHILFSL